MNQALQEDIKNHQNTLVHLSPKKRLNAIINHPAPLKLIQSLPSIDLLRIIREVGGEDTLELIELLSPEQVQEIFDLEIWSSDELHINAAGNYFSLLFEANPDTAVSQIYGLDIELLGLMFKLVATIYDTTLGEDPGELPEHYSLSPDGRFIVCFSENEQFQSLGQSLKLFLESLYGRDLSFALQLLERIRFELASYLEEESLRFRNNRLLEMGILPRDERLEYFAPIALSKVLSQTLQVTTSLNNSTNPWTLSLFRPEQSDDYPFLKTGLSFANEKSRERFLRELTETSINVHASLSGDFGDGDIIRKTLKYSAFLIELGIFQACRGQLDNAKDIINTLSAKYLFRLGRTSLITLRRRLILKTKHPSYVFGNDFCHVDTPLREVARALSLSEPRYYEGLLDPQKLLVRFFEHKTEVAATVKAVEELLFRAQLIGCLNLDHEQLKKHSELSHASIFARVALNLFLSSNFSLEIIAPSEIIKLFENQKLKPSVSQWIKNFAQSLSDKLPASEDERDRSRDKALNFATTVLIQLEQNWQLIVG